MYSAKHILPKGSSCATCKARKVKCDAQKPACGACVRSARFKHQDPSEITCCYGTPRRRSDKGVRGIGGSSTKRDIDDVTEQPARRETADVASIDENVDLDPFPLELLTLPFFDSGSLPSPSPSQLPLPLQPPSLDDLYSLPPLSSHPPSLATTTLYKPETFSPFGSQLWPTKIALLNYEPGPDFGSSDWSSLPSPTSTSTSTSSSVISEDWAGSFSSFDSFDSLDDRVNPFRLTEDFPFYDSSAAPSPPPPSSAATCSSSSSSSSLTPVECASESHSYSPENDFASLSDLPIFPLPLEW